MDTSLMLKFYIVTCAGVSTLSCLVSVYLYLKLKALTNSYLSVKEFFSDESKQLRKKYENLERMQVQVGQGLYNTEEKLQNWVERVNRLEIRDSHFGSYQHAAKLVELGAKAEDVIKTCGLSRAEADLVIMVNRKSKSHDASEDMQTKINNQVDEHRLNP